MQQVITVVKWFLLISERILFYKLLRTITTE